MSNKHRNYTKFSNHTDRDNSPVEPEEVEDIVSEKVTEGIVIDCVKLNVRMAPKPDAEVICTIQCLDKVTIEDTVGNFYHVHTENGIEGYCVKQFIAVQ